MTIAPAENLHALKRLGAPADLATTPRQELLFVVGCSLRKCRFVLIARALGSPSASLLGECEALGILELSTRLDLRLLDAAHPPLLVLVLSTRVGLRRDGLVGPLEDLASPGASSTPRRIAVVTLDPHLGPMRMTANEYVEGLVHEVGDEQQRTEADAAFPREDVAERCARDAEGAGGGGLIALETLRAELRQKRA
jgi:hypothetical protein